MSLILDQTPLPGHDPRLSVQQQIERRDQSGDSSSSAATHGGWKPKIFTYTCKLRFAEADALGKLDTLWRSVEGATKEPKVFTAAHPLLTALRVEKLKFTDFMKIAQDGENLVWAVSLTLIEASSIPERTEERAAAPTVADPKAPAGTQTTAKEAAAAFEEGGIEGVLAYIEENIAKPAYEWVGSL